MSQYLGIFDRVHNISTKGRRTGPVSVLFDLDDQVPYKSASTTPCAATTVAPTSATADDSSMAADELVGERSE